MLEQESSIFGNIRNFFRGEFCFHFRSGGWGWEWEVEGLDWEGYQVALKYTNDHL